MDDKVWGEAAPCATEIRPTGLKTLLMEETVASLRVLNAASCELLVAERHDENEALALAMTRVLGWLHRKIATPPLRTDVSFHENKEEQKAAEISALEELSQVFLHWYKLQQRATTPLSWRLWVMWVELGCALDVLRCIDAAEKKVDSCVLLMMSSLPPRDFPTSSNKEKQVSFTRELWDAMLAKPLDGAPMGAVEDVASRLVEVYLFWMTTAMRGYEVAFIANVATPLRGHLQTAFTSIPLLVDGWIEFAIKMGRESIMKNAASAAVTVLVLSALTSTQRSLEVAGYLESLSAAAVDELSRGSFPQPHNPVAIAAMALGVTILDDAKPPCNAAFQLQSGNATLLCQFALLRILTLQLLSPRLKPYDSVTVAGYEAEVHRRLKTLVLEPSHVVLQEYSIRMTEACIEEVVGFFQSSLKSYISLMEAVQSVLPSDLFRLKLLNQLQSNSTDSTDHDESLLASGSETVTFIKQFYEGVAPILEVLSAGHLVRTFLALSRIEFAREVSASPTANASMQTVTQQLEQALEQTAVPPDTIFAPALRSIAMHSMSANSDIPSEVDMVAGCQALAVGLVMQRKLRILLFQCTPLIDDALAVVFAGLYNVFAPVDAFAHRFLGVCLSHLGQFTPLVNVFPHYLQVTLVAFPTNASSQDLTKACGAIFGALFYSKALTVPTEQDSDITETAQRMVLWAIRKCCERSAEILAEEDKAIEASVLSESVKANTEGTGFAKEVVVTVPETDGLYLAGLIFELLKMAPINLLKASAMETEQLLACWKNNSRVLRGLKSALFARISQNCEAEKRAWLAAWYIEVDQQYPIEAPSAKPVAMSHL